jgi:hypothetical protein
MTTMSGKAEGRCRGVEGVYGWFSPGFNGYAAAVSWRDGQTAHEPHVRARWAILERLDCRWNVVRTWCLPPAMAELAAAYPDWTPDVPFDLLPPADRWQRIDLADEAGVPRPGEEPLVPRPAPPVEKPKRKRAPRKAPA